MGAKGFDVKKAGRSAINGTATAGKVGIAALFGLIATEVTFMGCNMIDSDIQTAKALNKFKKDPDVYQVKEKGWFKKPYNVNINPVTGEMHRDKTGKSPVNKKPIIL